MSILTNISKSTREQSIKAQLIETVARHLGNRHYRLWLFGSRAQGRATARSDYDLGIMAEQPLDLVTLARIRADLEELPILQQVDLVDLTTAPAEFVQQALQRGELLDER